MEILLQAGDKINIPTGCRATIVDNEIIIENDFKRGDILASTKSDCLVIFWKDCEIIGCDEAFDALYSTIERAEEYNTQLLGYNKNVFRYATEEEKKKLHEHLRINGLYWDDNTKTVGFIRNKKEEKPNNKSTDKYKDGDILCNEGQTIFVVFESYEADNYNYTFCSHYNNVGEDNKRWVPQYFHVASIEEQQLFFKELESKGLRWDAEIKEILRIY